MQWSVEWRDSLAATGSFGMKCSRSESFDCASSLHCYNGRPPEWLLAFANDIRIIWSLACLSLSTEEPQSCIVFHREPYQSISKACLMLPPVHKLTPDEDPLRDCIERCNMDVTHDLPPLNLPDSLKLQARDGFCSLAAQAHTNICLLHWVTASMESLLNRKYDSVETIGQ